MAIGNVAMGNEGGGMILEDLEEFLIGFFRESSKNLQRICGRILEIST